jgi:succinoglycan biosynthesis transport protein ExoP
MESSEQSLGLQTILEIWRRHKWLAILVFLVVLTAAASVIVFLPDIYTSTATILVERQKVPEEFVQSTVTSGVDLRLHTITQQLLSRSRLLGLVERFNLYSELRQQKPIEQVLGQMRQDIKLDLKSDKQGQNSTTVAFTVSYSGHDPRTVAQVTNTLASSYIEENLKVRGQQATNTADFLRVQLDGVKKQLEAQEQRLSAFKERHIGELPGQLQANLAVLERLNTQLRLNSEKQARIGEQRTAMAQQLAEIDRPAPVDASRPSARPETGTERLERMRQALTALRTRYGDKYPDVVQLQAEIAALEQFLTETKSESKSGQPQAMSPVDSYVQQLKKELATLAAEMRALRIEEGNLLKTVAVYQQRVENTPRREQEMQELQRDYESTRELYQSLLKRQEEARLAESLEQRQQGEQFRLLEPATPSAQPSKPDRRKLAMVGLMAALGLAAGAVFLTEQLDTSFHTVDDLRTFSQVPVLVNLPRIVTAGDTWRRRLHFGLGTVATVVGLVLIVFGSYVVVQGKTPELTELKGVLTQAQLLLQSVGGTVQ